MGLKTTIEEQTRHALKNQEAGRLSTLRLLLAAIHNREIEKKGKGGEGVLSEEEVISVIRSEAKKRKDASLEFEKAGRKDMSVKEEEERMILEGYLPPELSDADLEKIVQEVIVGLGSATVKDMGRVMGEAMKRIKGQASGERVSAVVRHMLGV